MRLLDTREGEQCIHQWKAAQDVFALSTTFA
jgi:hypothetical protein